MNNLSINGETVSFVSKSGYFLIFDILFSEKLWDKSFLFESVSPLNIKEIEAEIFKWSDGELLGLYEANVNDVIHIEIKKIKNYDEDVNIDINKDKVFGTDTGVVAVIDWYSITDFLEVFDYNIFVDTYSITQIQNKIGDSFAIISTPGMDKGFEFCGSGSYFIKEI